MATTLQWRHNGRNGVSNHQPHDCLLNRLFRSRSEKTPTLRVTGLCDRNSPVTGEFPAQRARCAENVSIWWRHHDYCKIQRTAKVFYWCMMVGNQPIATHPTAHFVSQPTLGLAIALFLYIWYCLETDGFNRKAEHVSDVSVIKRFDNDLPCFCPHESIGMLYSITWQVMDKTSNKQRPLLLTRFNFNPNMDK